MGKIKLLLDVVSDIRSLADSLQAVADVMVQNEPAVDMAAEEKAEPEKKADTKPAGKSARKKKVAAELEEQPLTLEEVRAVLAEKSRAGHTAEVKALLTKHGADKLSDVDPAEYPALLADAEAL